uniref:Sugar transporter ERD6-like 6 n=1 Tax=Cacopsylla melanoneura TaxID=428564 RepID=A0A8D8WLW5_9HEMI
MTTLSPPTILTLAPMTGLNILLLYSLKAQITKTTNTTSKTITAPKTNTTTMPNTTILSAPVDNAQASLIGSLMNIGAIFGALPAGFFADKFGRKPVILAFCIPFILGWVLILFAQSVLWLFIARFTQGVATGVIS